MSEAPTTLPTSTSTPTPWWLRLGAIVATPRQAFRALVDDPRAHPLEPLLVYAAVVSGIAAAEVYRLLALAGEAPLIVVRRLLDVVLHAGRTDFAVVVASALVVGGLAHAFPSADASQGRHRFIGAAIATSYLLVPLALCKALGGILALAGLEIWALPHRAVDSMVVVVAGRVDAVRFVVKCVVAYGPGLAILIAWWLTRARSLALPRAFSARAGLAALVVAVGMLGLGALANVAGRAEQLRPRLTGDAFPAVAIKKLSGKGRVDVTRLAAAPGTKAVVVDFWASWCGPCRRSLPELSKLAESWRGQGVVVIGVNREPNDLAAAQKAWADIGPTFDSLVDDKGLGDRVGLTSLPSSYVLDGHGVIRHMHLGYTDPAVVKAEVEALLSEPK